MAPCVRFGCKEQFASLKVLQRLGLIEWRFLTFTTKVSRTLPPHSHIQEKHSQPEPVASWALRNEKTPSPANSGSKATVRDKQSPGLPAPNQVPLSYTEDLSFINGDDDMTLSCVYYERNARCVYLISR